MIIIIRVSAVGSDRLTFTNELQIESVSQNIPVHFGFFSGAVLQGKHYKRKICSITFNFQGKFMHPSKIHTHIVIVLPSKNIDASFQTRTEAMICVAVIYGFAPISTTLL